MNEIKTLDDINRNTAEGMMLFKALVILSVRVYHHKTIEDILVEVNKISVPAWYSHLLESEGEVKG